MNLTFRLLKEIFPELNKKVINRDRIYQVFKQRRIEYYDLPMEGRGGYVTDNGRDYVFLRNSLRGLLHHETLAYEGVHAFFHYPAEFLRRKHDLEAETLSLVMLIPKTDLPRLNKIKHQLDEESFELIERRNKANSIWRL